jgi:hypothetical protein
MNQLILRSRSDFPMPIGQSQIRNPIVTFISGCIYSVLILMSIAGIAILSKHKPLSIIRTLPGHPNSSIVNGRIITLEFHSCYLIGTYVVNAGMGLKVAYLHISAVNSLSSLYRHLKRRKNGTSILKLIFEIWTKRNQSSGQGI